MLTYEKFVSGDSGSRYKYGEKFPFRRIIMASFESIGVVYLYILLLLPTSIIAGHDCSPAHSKFYLEAKLGRDVSWVRHDSSGTCSVQFVNSAG